MSNSTSNSPRFRTGGIILFTVRLKHVSPEHFVSAFISTKLTPIGLLLFPRLPNGEVDQNSRHGGCPVLSGVKVCGV
jgi:hypothetical protein